MSDVKAFYVAVFNEDMDCYVQYGINMGIEDAKKLLASKRQSAPSSDWTILAILDV